MKVCTQHTARRSLLIGSTLQRRPAPVRRTAVATLASMGTKPSRVQQTIGTAAPSADGPTGREPWRGGISSWLAKTPSEEVKRALTAAAEDSKLFWDTYRDKVGVACVRARQPTTRAFAVRLPKPAGQVQISRSMLAHACRARSRCPRKSRRLTST